MKKLDRILAVLEKEKDCLYRVSKSEVLDEKLKEECKGELMHVTSVIWMLTDDEYLKAMEDIYLD